MRYALVIAGLLGLAPLAGSAQQSAEPQARQERAEARVQTALQTALQAGVPVALLERKVAEGRAKGVPMARIAVAVETRLQALLRARTALQQARLESTTEGDLSIAADAVQAGVSDAAIAEVARNAPRERRAVAVAVLANLVALGHASDRALGQVRAALGRGPEALLNLHARSAAELKARGAGNGIGLGVGGAASGNARGGGSVDPPGKGKGKGHKK